MTIPNAGLKEEIVRALTIAREAERELIGALPAEVRDAPAPDGGWSPKDIQAHITAWRNVQLERFAAVQRGEPQIEIEEIDAVNARFHTATADRDWAWVEAEADRIAEAFIAAVREIDPALLVDTPRLLGRAIRTAAAHGLEHLDSLPPEHVPSGRVDELTDEVQRIVRGGSFPPGDIGTFLYNRACHAALNGRLEEARGWLPEAFRLRPDLLDLARTDPDLIDLRGEFDSLASSPTPG